MAKKDKKKDPEKKAALQAKKEAKADKAAQKRLKKDAGGSAQYEGGEGQQQDDALDTLISSYAKLDMELTTPVIEPMTGFPSPRANFSLTVLPNNDMLMFGGEYFDGAVNVVYEDLFQWSPDAKVAGDDEKEKSNDVRGGTTSSDSVPNKGEWKRILCPAPRPAPRCAHSAVLYNTDVYVFGGELATLDQFHHYRDFWNYSTKSHLWTEVKPRTPGPTPRSGHRCIVWRHYMIVFGGFYEALRETPRWFNDLWVYDFADNSWMECKYSKLTSMPDARSGFVFGLHSPSDTAFLYGGFSKVRNPGDIAEGKVHTDCWALNLKPVASRGIPTWNRVSRKGEYPSARTSLSGIVHKHRIVVFGGVYDEEQDHHVVSSVFYDDMFALDMEKRRWFKLALKKASAKKNRRRAKKSETVLQGEGDAPEELQDGDASNSEDEDESKEGEAESSGWGLDKLRANMFAFIDGNGNVVYEKLDAVIENEENVPSEQDDGYMADKGEYGNAEKAESSDEEDEEKEEENDGPAARTVPPFIPPGGIGESQVMKVNNYGIPAVVERSVPLPRIKPALTLRNNTLYLFGGILEVGDREVTLDDVWSLDLQKRERWSCIHEGSMHQQVWKGVESDNESYISTGNDAESVDGDDDEDSDEASIPENTANDGVESGKKSAKISSGAKEKQGKHLSGIRAELERLKNELESSDTGCAPQVAETMADFYARTSEFWTQKALESMGNVTEGLVDKELKKIGFGLARERFGELKPILDRIVELNGQLVTSGDGSKLKKKEKTASSMSNDRRKNRAK